MFNEATLSLIYKDEVRHSAFHNQTNREKKLFFPNIRTFILPQWEYIFIFRLVTLQSDSLRLYENQIPLAVTKTKTTIRRTSLRLRGCTATFGLRQIVNYPITQ